MLEKNTNVASYRGLLRAMEITLGRTEPTNHPLDICTLDIPCISYYLLIYQHIVASCTCRDLCISVCPLDSWDLIFLFLHLISKHRWLHSYKLLWLEGPGLVSGFARVLRFLSLHMYFFFGFLFLSKAVIDHLDSKMLYCSFLMNNLLLCDYYWNFILLVMQFIFFW